MIESQIQDDFSGYSIFNNGTHSKERERHTPSLVSKGSLRRQTGGGSKVKAIARKQGGSPVPSRQEARDPTDQEIHIDSSHNDSSEQTD